jgi:hypothetical protein
MSNVRKFERIRATVEVEFLIEPAEGEEGMAWDTADILEIAYNPDENIVKSDATFVFVETLTEAEAIQACERDFHDSPVHIRPSS